MALRILLVHNRYQMAGGEDRVLEAEAVLLQKNGHEVIIYSDSNERIADMGKLKAASETIWSRESYRRVYAKIREHGIQLCHFHNTFPLISPSAYYAASHAGVPVVQTLHNYRILCPGSLLMRDGHVCEECVNRTVVWPGAIHRCYRRSYLASATAAVAISTHNLLNTWSRKVNRYIALGEFGRQKFIQGGLPAQRIAVKPNFVDPDPGYGTGDGGYALFVGRLSPEKGILTLLEAWRNNPEFPVLRIAGTGPLAALVESATSSNPRVEWLGETSREQTLNEMRHARFLICPSIWYECFALVVVEAFACGLPVIASSLGALPELIQPQRNGLLFTPASAQDLAAQVRWALLNEHRIDEMRPNARREYETRYTAPKNYQMLASIYDQALSEMPRGGFVTSPAAA
jgi:glycosyltransferase involved in cell wall biosynthesis